MINKIVIISSPYTKTVEHIHIDNVIIIKIPTEARSLIANVDCEELSWENGMVNKIVEGE